MKRIRKAVFPVGGLGTRFLPATKAMPKEMLAIVDKPLIQYALEEARAAGLEEFIFVTGKGKTAIEDHFDYSYELEAVLKERNKYEELEELRAVTLQPGEISYTRQMQPLGLGHAVWCARQLIGDEPFAVLLADDFIWGNQPCLKQMIEAYETVGGNMVAVMDVPQTHISRYGVIDIAQDKGNLVQIRGMVEKPAPQEAPSNLAIIGRYLLQPEIFDCLENQTPGRGGEIQLTDALSALLKEQPFHGFRFDGRRFDCGSKVGFLSASLHVGLERPDIHQELVAEMEALLRHYGGEQKTCV